MRVTRIYCIYFSIVFRSVYLLFFKLLFCDVIKTIYNIVSGFFQNLLLIFLRFYRTFTYLWLQLFVPDNNFLFVSCLTIEFLIIFPEIKTPIVQTSLEIFLGNLFAIFFKFIFNLHKFCQFLFETRNYYFMRNFRVSRYYVIDIFLIGI